MNQLQAVAMNEGYRWKKKLFSEQGRALLEKLSLAPWASRRRKELLELLDQLDPKIVELTAAVEHEAKKRPEVVQLMTHPGVGPITGLAYALVIGTPERFPSGKQIGSYVGLIPCEDSSAGRQRLGHISKQGNTLLRFLLVEAAQAAARCNPDWRRRYLHLMMRREKRIAKVAMARKLAVWLYWMWRNGWDHSQLVEFGSNAGKLARHDSLSLPLRLRHVALVVLQQTAQSLPTPHRCLSISCSFPLQRKQNQILFALVVALLVIMHHILLQRSPQRTLPKQNQPRQAFLFDRSHPALRKRIQVRAPRWQANRFDTSRFDQFTKRGTELRIPVMQQVAAASQKSPLLHGCISCLLFHPLLARVGRHSCQAHPPTLQVNEKQDIVSNQPLRTAGCRR